MGRGQRTKWWNNSECPLCECFRKGGRGKFGDILVKKSPDGKRHRHLTSKELKKISDEYNERMLKDAEEVEKEQEAAMVEARRRGVFNRIYK